jgi:hypothetical protein
MSPSCNVRSMCKNRAKENTNTGRRSTGHNFFEKAIKKTLAQFFLHLLRRKTFTGLHSTEAVPKFTKGPRVGENATPLAFYMCFKSGGERRGDTEKKEKKEEKTSSTGFL